MANLLPMDVAQEAHFSNRDTWDRCQDGKQIRDVSKQSAETPQSRGFLFLARAKPPLLSRFAQPIKYTLNTAPPPGALRQPRQHCAMAWQHFSANI